MANERMRRKPSLKRRKTDFDGKPLARPKPEDEKGIIRQVKSGLDVYNGGDPDETPPKSETIPDDDLDEPPPKQEALAPSGGSADVIPIAEDEASHQRNVAEMRSFTVEL